LADLGRVIVDTVALRIVPEHPLSAERRRFAPRHRPPEHTPSIGLALAYQCEDRPARFGAVGNAKSK
jgi:hypothetical protein